VARPPKISQIRLPRKFMKVLMRVLKYRNFFFSISRNSHLSQGHKEEPQPSAVADGFREGDIIL
jgi:hypothetical protein